MPLIIARATTLYIIGLNYIYGDKIKTYIASTDYHFSPIRKYTKESSIVSDRFFKKYEVMCNWPDKVCDTIRK